MLKVLDYLLEHNAGIIYGSGDAIAQGGSAGAASVGAGARRVRALGLLDHARRHDESAYFQRDDAQRKHAAVRRAVQWTAACHIDNPQASPQGHRGFTPPYRLTHTKACDVVRAQRPEWARLNNDTIRRYAREQRPAAILIEDFTDLDAAGTE